MSRQVVEHSVSCVLKALVGLDESAVERPFAASGVHLTSSYQEFQLVVVESEDNAIDGNPYF